MTALSTVSPRNASASAFSFWRIIALTSGGEYSLPPAETRASPFGPRTTLNGTIVSSSFTSASLRPMKRLTEKTVFSGLVTAWRFATAPTRRSPPCVNATTDGVVRAPSEFSMTFGSPPSSTAMQEFVVPRSIPIVLAMLPSSFRKKSKRGFSRSLPGCHPFSIRAQRKQRALGTVGAAGGARAAPMADQGDVELVRLVGESQHLVVRLLERRPGPKEPQAGADAEDVSVDRHVREPVREEQDARRRLAPDPRQRAQVLASLLDRGRLEPSQVVAVERAQDGLDHLRLRGCQAPGANRLLHLLRGRVAHSRPIRKPLAQPAVGDVAVAVVGVLREHREHQLVDGRAVGFELGLAVRRPQAFHDRPHAPAVRPLPVAPVTFHAWTSSTTAPRSPGSRPSGARPAMRPSCTSTATRTTRTCGYRSSSVPAASRWTSRVSGGQRSRPTSTTRSRATASGSTRSAATSAGNAAACSCTTGVPSGSLSAHASTGSRWSTRSRFSPATSGTGSHASGGPRCWASSSRERRRGGA